MQHTGLQKYQKSTHKNPLANEVSRFSGYFTQDHANDYGDSKKKPEHRAGWGIRKSVTETASLGGLPNSTQQKSLWVEVLERQTACYFGCEAHLQFIMNKFIARTHKVPKGNWRSLACKSQHSMILVLSTCSACDQTSFNFSMMYSAAGTDHEHKARSTHLMAN